MGSPKILSLFLVLSMLTIRSQTTSLGGNAALREEAEISIKNFLKNFLILHEFKIICFFNRRRISIDVRKKRTINAENEISLAKNQNSEKEQKWIYPMGCKLLCPNSDGVRRWLHQCSFHLTLAHMVARKVVLSLNSLVDA